MSARAREKDRLTRPIHVRRADVALSFRDDRDFLVEVLSRALLNDLTPSGFCVYAETGLNPNAEITAEIEHPKRFRLTAKVVWCQYQPSSSHVITDRSFPYRIGLALIWKNAEAEEAFKKYCAELENLYVNKKALFLEEAFKEGGSVPTPEAVAAATAVDVPAPTESDEGGAPSEEKVAAEMAAAAAADIAAKALSAANPAPAEAAAPPAGESSAADVLNALKDIDPGVPASDEKKAA